MKYRQYFLWVTFLSSYAPLLAQVDTAWVRRYNGPGNSTDEAKALAVDGSGNVYVTGYTGSFPASDYATIKYAPNGDTLWVRTYNGPGNSDDNARALAVDDSGNLYVTGFTFGPSSYDYATIKYAPNGDTLWVKRYNGSGNEGDLAYALAVDDSGNVYVAGVSDGSGTADDYATIKYAPNGDTVWVKRYSGPVFGPDEAKALAVDDSGNVYVTGSSWSGTSDDYATIKYSSSGDTLWVRRYNGTGNGNDQASALAVDGGGNVYVTGSSVGNGTSFDYTTIKYAPNGDTLWVRRYNGPLGNGNDQAYALAVDNAGNVYVTGGSHNGTGGHIDYATIKYAPNGDTLWVRRYDGPPGNDNDQAYALALDNSGNVYVTGGSYGSVSSQDYATIKYFPDGDTVWVRRYNGPENGNDYAIALAVDSNGNVYVNGESFSNAGLQDYTTVKYFQCLAKPGDVTGDGQVLLPDIVALVNFRFRSGPTPNPFCRGDANGDGSILLQDIIYLVNSVFRSGPAPVKSGQCCL